MAVRPFLLCTASDRAAFAKRASEALSAWAAEWLGSAVDAAVACDGAAVAASGDDSAWLQAHGAAGTVWMAADQVRALATWLFGAPPAPAGSVSTAVALEGLTALLLRLAAAPAEAGNAVHRVPAPLHLLEPGRAAVRGCVVLAGAELVFLAELAAPGRAVVRIHEPLAGMNSALGTQEVRLDAWLGEAELELRALRTLAVGDVLRLSTRLDDPVELRVNRQRLPCSGYLGARDGRLAVEIARR